MVRLAGGEKRWSATGHGVGTYGHTRFDSTTFKPPTVGDDQIIIIELFFENGPKKSRAKVLEKKFWHTQI